MLLFGGVIFSVVFLFFFWVSEKNSLLLIFLFFFVRRCKKKWWKGLHDESFPFRRSRFFWVILEGIYMHFFLHFLHVAHFEVACCIFSCLERLGVIQVNQNQYLEKHYLLGCVTAILLRVWDLQVPQGRKQSVYFSGLKFLEPTPLLGEGNFGLLIVIFVAKYFWQQKYLYVFWFLCWEATELSWNRSPRTAIDMESDIADKNSWRNTRAHYRKQFDP